MIEKCVPYGLQSFRQVGPQCFLGLSVSFLIYKVNQRQFFHFSSRSPGPNFPNFQSRLTVL